MIQLVVDGIFLDLYENDPPKVTLQFDSFATFQPQSSYTQAFRVPATDKNFDFFKSVFEVNGYDFDVTIRHEAQILVDGAEFMSGELRLQKIYNRPDSGTDYECVFFGELRDLASKLGNKKMSQLDLSALNHSVSMLNVTTSWLAFPTTKDRFNNDYNSTLTTGLKNGNVLYPLVDFGNTYDENELTQEVSISVGSGKHITQGNPAVVPIDERIWANRFKPMVRAKYLLDRVFAEAELSYTSNFLDAPLNVFQRLYVSAWGNSDSIYLDALTGNCNVAVPNPFFYDVAPTPAVRIPFNQTITDPSNSWNELNNSYSTNIAATTNVTFQIQIIGNKRNNTSETLSFRLMVDGVLQDTVVSPAGQEEFTVFFDNILSLGQLDDVYVEVISTSFHAIEVTAGSFKAFAPGEVNVAGLLDEDYKQIDFIRDICTLAKLVLIPDRNQPGNFIIEPWQSYVGSGGTHDWTDKLDVSKDVQIEPIFYDQSESVTFTTETEGDWLNKLNQDQFKENFGDLRLESDNDLLKGEKKVEIKMAATPVSEIQGASTNTGTGSLVGRDNMVIPHIYTLEAGETRPLKRPIKPKTRFLLYNGLKYTGRTFNGLNSNTDTSAPWYWTTDTFQDASSELFPQVSPYQYTFNDDAIYNPQELSLNLTWQAENGYLRIGQLSPGYSIYDLYWGRYIKLIYDKYSRRVTANFVLSHEDLVDFQFKDVVFVKDAYYYVEKIENIELGNRNSVRVQLIKLIDYNPSQGGYVPPFQGLVWNNIGVDWDVLEGQWGAF